MNSLQKSIEIAGSQGKLALRIVEWHSKKGNPLTLSQQSISKWLITPSEHCRAIEEITNGAVTRYDLRPDVFGTLADCKSSQTETSE